MHLANIYMGDFCTHFYNWTWLCVYKEARFTNECKYTHSWTQSCDWAGQGRASWRPRSDWWRASPPTPTSQGPSSAAGGLFNTTCRTNSSSSKISNILDYSCSQYFIILKYFLGVCSYFFFIILHFASLFDLSFSLSGLSRRLCRSPCQTTSF